jgi:DNA-binding IclR family transcriptional regulator
MNEPKPQETPEPQETLQDEIDAMPASFDDRDIARYTVPALARGLEILSYFTREQPILSGARISKITGLPRASVFRMLQTLELAGYLVRVGEPGTHPSYRLGVAVLRLGFEYLNSQEITEQGRPVIESLCDFCGYTSHIVVRDERDVVIVAKALGRKASFHSIQVGTRLPAHATVLGRVLMIGMSLPEIEKLYARHDMTLYTKHTPRSSAELKARIDEAQAQGYAVSQGGFESGISTIAAPVFDEERKVCAAVSITVMSSSIDALALPSLIEQVKEAASQLTWRLQHSVSFYRHG